MWIKGSSSCIEQFQIFYCYSISNPFSEKHLCMCLKLHMCLNVVPWTGMRIPACSKFIIFFNTLLHWEPSNFEHHSAAKVIKFLIANQQLDTKEHNSEVLLHFWDHSQDARLCNSDEHHYSNALSVRVLVLSFKIPHCPKNSKVWVPVT